jgi:hypothetical protein
MFYTDTMTLEDENVRIYQVVSCSSHSADDYKTDTIILLAYHA